MIRFSDSGKRKMRQNLFYFRSSDNETNIPYIVFCCGGDIRRVRWIKKENDDALYLMISQEFYLLNLIKSFGSSGGTKHNEACMICVYD